MICFTIDCLIFSHRLTGGSHHKKLPVKWNMNVNTTTRSSSRCVFLPPECGIPSQWGWPPDLLLFALVATLSQDSVHHLGTHQQPRTVHQPGWSAWTKSKQITFPCVTDLQLTDRTACQRMTTKRQRGMNHPYLFPARLWMGKALERALWYRLQLGDQPDVWEIFLTYRYEWIIRLTQKIIQLLSGYWAEIRASGEGKHETIEGKVILADVTMLSHFLLFYTQLILPEDPASLVKMKAVPSSVGHPGYGRHTGLQLGSCYWRGCHHCHVTLGTAAGRSCWSLDHSVKGSSVTALGSKEIPEPDMDGASVFLTTAHGKKKETWMNVPELLNVL